MSKRLTPIYRNNFRFYHHSHYNLDDTCLESIQQLFRLLKIACKTSSKRRIDMVTDLLEVLFLILHDYLQENDIATHQLNSREQLFSDFYDAIVEHHRESREVRFYADLFCLTPKHFATLIKQQTGVTASEWINNYVIQQAKTMLRYQQQLNIQQISHLLGFSEHSAFCRYFKNNTGMSPTEYREES